VKKKIIIPAALLAIAAVMAVVLAQAGRSDSIADNPPLDLSLNNIEFVEIYYNPSLKGSVAVDKQTGVMYWFSRDGIATLLVDAENRPRIWRNNP
jgi:hypothetical protein